MKQLSSFLITLISILYCANVLRAQMVPVITTVAGNDTAGYKGDNGPATAGELSFSTGVCIDGVGNIYIADAGNNRIRKVDASGIITTVAGNGKAAYRGDGAAATNAALDNPTGVAVDAAGNIYIADYLNSVIRKVNTSGIIITIAGNYLLDSALGGGGYSGDGGPATAAELNFPTGVCLDDTGNVYIADASNNVIRKVNTSGIITTIAGNYTIGAAYSGDGGLATAAALNSPEGLFADAAGNIYIADAGNNVIREINTSGIIATIIGNYALGGSYSGDGGAATDAALNTPTGVVVDSVGNIYIADLNNLVIQKIDTSGIINTVAGNGSYGFSGDGGLATSAELNQPYGVAVDGAGKIYIADDANNDIRKVANGLVSSVNGVQSPNGDVCIYPNPASIMLTIKVAQATYSSFTISNSEGEIILKYQINASQTDVNIKSLPAGIYYVILNGDNGILVRKVLKE